MAVTCTDCKKEFSNKSNCRRHYRVVHKGESLKIKEKVLECPICSKIFKLKYTFQNHIESVHNMGIKKQCSECEYSTCRKSLLIRHIRRKHGNEEKPNRINVEQKTYRCMYCSSQFSHKRNLMYHERKKHDIRNLVLLHSKKICPLCDFSTDILSFKGNEVMYKHFENVHGLPMIWETLQFSSVSDFDNWKCEFEKKSRCKFIYANKYSEKINNNSSNNNNKSKRFVCHRSGIFKSKGSGKRALKFVAPCKINGFCPASIVAKTGTDGEVNVSILNVHIGHENQPEPLSDLMVNNYYEIPFEYTSIEIKAEETISTEEVFQDAEFVVSCEEEVEEAGSFEESKEKFVQELSEMLMEKISNMEELKYIQEYCKQLEPILESMKQC